VLLYWHEFCIPLWLGSNSWHQQNRRHQFKIAGPSGPPQKIEKPNRKFYCKTHTHTHSQAARTCKQLTYWNVVKWCRPWKLQSSLEPNYQQYIKLPLEKYNHTYIINSHPHSCDVTNAYSISWLVHPTQCTMSHNFNFWKNMRNEENPSLSKLNEVAVATDGLHQWLGNQGPWFLATSWQVHMQLELENCTSKTAEICFDLAIALDE